jgi:hypothetical protein
VAALAYLVPPLSGLVVYFTARGARMRFHGLQSVLLGLLWPAALLGGSVITPGASQVAGVGGALAWLWFLVGAALGRDPRWPLAGSWLEAAASQPPR